MTGPDAFLSHNSHDKPFVESVAKVLEKAGLSCVLDDWDLHPAGNWLRSLEDALKQCKFFVLFIGPNGLGPYHQAELDVALQRQIQERRKLIIPVLLPGTPPKVLDDISVFLTCIQALEFREQDDECALNLLIGLLNEEDPQHLRNLLKQKSAPSSALLRSLDDWFSGLTIGWQENVCKVAIGQGKQCLTIPFKPFQASLDNVASQLEWNYQLTGFIGRERELNQLQGWADGERLIDIQPIVGEGGVGKTRLAFEFAARLRQQGWQAGEAGQTLEGAWYTGRAGILLVIDYPEHRSERVMQLLEALDHLENPNIKIRILLLTRHADFAERLSLNARALIRRELSLHGFSEAQNQWDLLQAAWKSLIDIEQAVHAKELPVDETAFSHWIARDNFHRNPLIILALAVYLFGDTRSDTQKNHQNLLDINGRDVVRELTLREIKRINKEIPKEFQKGTILIKALAAITGGLDLQQCDALLDRLKTQSITPATPELNQLLEYSIVTNDCIQPLSPDIFAADFLIYALTQYAKLNPAQWQLAVLEFTENRLQNWSRFGRLVFDAQYKLNHRWPMDDLAKKVVQNNELCEWIANEFVNLDLREKRLNPIGIAALKKIIADEGIEALQKARVNFQLSILLAETGDSANGLEVIQRATQTYEQLANERFSDYAPDLAASLNNLSNRLADNGDRSGALYTIKRAVEIREQLAKENFSAYGSALARSLNNLSVRLAESDDLAGGLASIRRAVDIREQLAKENFKAYGSDLARSLNNLSIRLNESGDCAAGLAAIKRAVEIREQLAEDDFSAYGSDLAGSLNNLSLHLIESRDCASGLVAIKRAVEVYERLANESFSIFGEDLCLSFCTQFFYFEQEIDLLNRLWNVHQQVKQFTHHYFENGFVNNVKKMLNELRENGDKTMIAKLQEIHDTLTKPQA